ncbi:MAG: NAD(P)/FAD-dependent oxidoreductase [Chloroflexi bacterium]|nr:NAD(P)/FAD-dependent oxidoreductase [Chloroflexota bacterium]
MTTPTEQATTWLTTFADTLGQGDANAVAALFDDECYWRDFVAFTWNLKTLEGRDAICAMVEACVLGSDAADWQIDGEAKQADDGTVEAWITFETAAGRGKGRVRLRDGRCYVLFTTLQELKGFEEERGPTRPLGAEHGGRKGRVTWLQRREQERIALGYTEQPYVLIIGGGQGGIGLGARLRQLQVPTIIVDRNARPGDAWRNRYDALTLHDTVWYDHLPYIPFPAHWPVYTPKDKMGDWLEAYTTLMELNYWSGTECVSASYDESASEWAVHVSRNGEPVTLRPKHLVLATGMSGKPNIPDFPGMDQFTGDIYHSSRYRSGATYSGQRAVVVGANNSAHDIAQDLWEHDADVTMIQRSSSTVVKSGSSRSGVGPYSEGAIASGLSADLADLLAAATPLRLAPIGAARAARRMREDNAEFYAALEASGFMLDFGEDETGVGMKYLRRGSGYYIDVGASQLVINGEIKLESGVNVERINQRSVTLTNGVELPADLIVLATGYGSMNGWAADLISQEVADRVGKVWGYGSDTAYDPGPWEGEQRNMWKPTQQPGLWFHGGNLSQSRQYSRYLALQLKARLEHIPTVVYGLQPVHHLA